MQWPHNFILILMILILLSSSSFLVLAEANSISKENQITQEDLNLLKLPDSKGLEKNKSMIQDQTRWASELQKRSEVIVNRFFSPDTLGEENKTDKPSNESKIEQIKNFLDQALSIRTQPGFQEWSKQSSLSNKSLSDELMDTIEEKMKKINVATEEQNLKEIMKKRSFITSFENLTNSKFVNVRALGFEQEGKKAFHWRLAQINKLIEEARQLNEENKENTNRIDILVWALYDDSVGALMAKKIVELAELKTSVTLIVDGLTSVQAPYNKIISKLEKIKEDNKLHTLKVVRWRDWSWNETNPFKNYWAKNLGTHSKVIFIQRKNGSIKSCEVGGRNIGTEYFFSLKDLNEKEKKAFELSADQLEMNEFYKEITTSIDKEDVERLNELDQSGKYSDASLVAKGNVCDQVKDLIEMMSQKSYNSNWQKSITTSKDLTLLNHTKSENKSARISSVAIVDHRAARDNNGLYSYLLSIRAAGAGDEIYIKNAYTVLNTPFIKALSDATKRGAKVLFLTNDIKSIDEAALGVPMMLSVYQLYLETKKSGNIQNLEIYLKNENRAIDRVIYSKTLHDKVMVAASSDRKAMLSIVGSQNLHPRSHRMDGETTIVTSDLVTGLQLIKNFENSLLNEAKSKEIISMQNNEKNNHLINLVVLLESGKIPEHWAENKLLQFSLNMKINPEDLFFSEVF